MTTKPEHVDMSETAIGRRLEIVRALYKLMCSLREARIEPPRAADEKNT